MDDFIAHFDSLSGTTIGERRKALFHLLNRTKATSDKLDFTLLQPKTSLQEAFKIDALIYFEQVDELLQVLKNENPRLIKKVLNAKPALLNRMFLEMDPNYLVNEFFLDLSFNTKQKLLTKFTLHLNDSPKADSIFKAVKDKYGTYLAVKLLPCCSEELILSCVNSKIEITPSQMLAIVRRHPQATVAIFERLREDGGESKILNKYPKVFKFVAQTNEDVFFNLLQTKHVNVRLGRRTTEKLVDKRRERVIERADRVKKVAHKKRLYKSLRGDFFKFYVNLLPETLEKFEQNYKHHFDVITELPPNFNKLDILVNSFESKYGVSLWNYPRFVTASLLELMSQEQRAIWMKNREKPSSLSDDVWTCLEALEESIPKLKKRIASTSSINERAQLVGALVETCRINGNDKVALLDVSKYVLKSHSNDDKIVVRCFLTSLKKCFVLEKLEAEQWKCIKKMTDLLIAKKEMPYHYSEWVSEYIYFCYSQKQTFDEQLKMFIKHSPYGTIYLPNCGRKQLGAFYKEYYSLSSEIISKNYEGDEFKNRYVTLLNAAVFWNTKHKRKEKIDITSFKQIEEFLLSQYVNQTGYSSLGEQIIMPFAKSFDPKYDKLLDAFFNRKNVYIDLNIYLWFLKYRPLVIQKYVRGITSEVLRLWHTMIYSYFWKYAQNYTHLEIPQKMIEVCLEVLNLNDSERQTNNEMPALSCLMESRDFLKLITPYYPTELVMDLTSESNKKKYELQQSITSSLKNLTPPSSAVDIVLKFSQGDYLKSVQRSLYSISHNSSEKNLPNLFNSLADRAVSVRKHAIYLTFKVTNRVQIYKLVDHFTVGEKNSSILKFLFKALLRLFAQNPDDHLWALVQKFAHKLDKEDKECYEAILEVQKVPSHYVRVYVEFFLEFLNRFVQDEQLASGRLRLLKALTVTNSTDLPKEFCLKIMKTDFLKENVGDQQQHDEVLNGLVCKFIFHSPEVELNERLGQLFAVLTSLRTPGGDCKWKNSTRHFAFVKRFCRYPEEEKCSRVEVIAKFVDMWKGIWRPHEAFLEFLHLEFSLIWCSSQRGAKIAQLCTSLFVSYGVAVLRIFSGYLHAYLLDASSRNSSEGDLKYGVFPLIEEILRESRTTDCLLLVISLLPKEASFLAPYTATYDQTLDLLEQNSDPLIVLTLNSYYERVQNLMNDVESPNGEKPDFSDYCPLNKYELDCGF